MRKAFYSTIIMAILVWAAGCKKVTETTGCLNGAFTGVIDGSTFTAKSFKTSLLRSSASDDSTKRLDIWATSADGKTVVLTVLNLQNADSGKCVSAKDYFVSDSLNYHNAAGYELAVGTYYPDSTSTPRQTFPVPSAQGKITISSCNSDVLKVSGSFNFITSINGYPPMDTIQGSFTDICYTLK